MIKRVESYNLNLPTRTREIKKREEDIQPKTVINVNINLQLNISPQFPINLNAILKTRSRCTKGRLNTLA